MRLQRRTHDWYRVPSLTEAAERGGRRRSLIDIHLLAAVGYHARQNSTEALDAVWSAIALAGPEAIRRPFLDDAAALAPVLKNLSKREAASAFVRSLTPEAETAAPARNHPDLIEPLSDREADVLRLLRSDLSGPEIANELAVSLNTLRTHTKNIFEKLGVNSRRAAVHRAEELQLFARDPRT